MKLTLSVSLVAATLFVAACANPETESRIQQLEGRVTQLEAQAKAAPAAPVGGPAAQPTVDPEQEKAAQELFREANEAVNALDYDTAKVKLAALSKDYGATRAARMAQRLDEELSIIGRDAGDLKVENWFQGETTMASGKATLIVFWESWCPHCQREVPNLQATWEKYGSQGLNMVGLTRISKTSTPEKVQEFIKEHGVTYSMAKEGGDISERFGVRGIPAAAVVKDGKIVWRGHPAKITPEMIGKWLS